MVEIVTRLCDLCGASGNVTQVTMKAGNAKPWTADLCRDCLGRLKSQGDSRKSRFHKVKLPPQPS